MKSSSQNQFLKMLNTAMGSGVAQYLEDPQVVELMLNPDGRLWIDRLGAGRSDTGIMIGSAEAAQIIYLVARTAGEICNEDNPILSAEFPGSGNRFQGMLPPVVAAPVFTLRKKAVMVFNLSQYVEAGIVTPEQKETLNEAVKAKLNILIVGGTGSGKTTLANAILNEIAKTNDRIIVLEDTLELQCTAPDTVFLRSRDHVPMESLLKATMRLRPDRIVVGEVRGVEALTLLDAWNTGHPGGLCTVHANSATSALTRIESLIKRVSATPQREVIAEAINLIVYIEKCKEGRRVKEIIKVEGFDQRYLLKPIS